MTRTESIEESRQQVLKSLAVTDALKEVTEWLEATCEDFDEDQRKKFWTAIQVIGGDRSDANQPMEDFIEASQPEPMNLAELRAFEQVLCPFQAFKDVPFKDVPTSYLRRLCDPNETIAKIRRYLASPHFVDDEE